jgi:hypothetical protein
LERRLKSHKTQQLLEQLGKTKAKQILNNKEALELLLYPRFCVRHPVSDKEVLQTDFAQNVMKGFQLLQPFNELILEGMIG